MLARFGTNNEGLVFGDLGGSVYSYAQFLLKLNSIDYLIVHNGRADHNDDDDVLKREFDNSFQEVDELLELASTETPKWVESLRKQEACTLPWSLEAGLEATLKFVWNDYYIEEEEIVIGYVDDQEIKRECKIYRPKRPVSVDDL
jgi:hypothetical protein